MGVYYFPQIPDIIQERRFQPFAFWSNQPGVEFHAAPTDMGSCLVYSGTSLGKLFKVY